MERSEIHNLFYQTKVGEDTRGKVHIRKSKLKNASAKRKIISHSILSFSFIS